MIKKAAIADYDGTLLYVMMKWMKEFFLKNLQNHYKKNKAKLFQWVDHVSTTNRNAVFSEILNYFNFEHN